MIETTPGSRSALATMIRVLIVLEAVVFFLAALMHAGVRIPVGFVEPVIIPAAIVEGLIGLLLAVAAYALYARKSWGWTAAVAAHVFGMAGVVLGMIDLTTGQGPRTAANDLYHRVTMIVLVAVLILLRRSRVKAALGHGDRTTP